MNYIVTKFSKDNTSTSFPYNNQDTNNTRKGDKESSLNINDDNNNNRTTIWKSFISTLEKFKDIQSEIKEQIETQNKLQKELDYLNKQKQDAAAYLQIAFYFINEINHRISYLKGFTDYFNNDIEKKIDSHIKNYCLLLIIIISNNIQKEEKKEDNKDKQ